MDKYSNAELFASEFAGTMLLILIGVGVCANTNLKKAFGYGHDWLLISFGWGFGVFVGASVAWRSGAQLNPAVTFAQALSDTMEWSLVPMFLVAQLLGAMTGAALAYLLYKKQFDTHDEPENTGGIFYTGPSVKAPPWNLVSEIIATFVFVFWVLESSPFTIGIGDAIVADSTQSALSYAAAAFVVIAVGASLGGATGYAINPARDLGPRIIYSILPIKGKGSSNWGYAWVPILGPFIGAAIATGLFWL